MKEAAFRDILKQLTGNRVAPLIKRIVRQSGLQRQGCAGEVRFFAGNGGIQEGDDDRYGQIRLEQEVLLKSHLDARPPL